MDMYSLIPLVLLGAAAWVFFHTRYKPHEHEVLTIKQNLVHSKPQVKYNSLDEKRARGIILEARRALKQGDAMRASETLKRVKAYPQTQAYRDTQSLKTDDNGLIQIASLVMFDRLFENVLDCNGATESTVSSAHSHHSDDDMTFTDSNDNSFLSDTQSCKGLEGNDPYSNSSSGSDTTDTMSSQSCDAFD